MNDSNRYTKIVLGLIFAALVLLSRLFYVQIVDSKYKTDAMNNSILRETIYPPRGIIYDRKGQILVGNRTATTLWSRHEKSAIWTPRRFVPY